MSPPEQVLDQVWRFEAVHPEWTPDESGEDGWEPTVAWYAVGTGAGLVIIDPLLTDTDTDPLDHLVKESGGCAAIVRTCHWHQRSVAETGTRYGAEVWAKRHPDGQSAHPADHFVIDGDRLPGGLRVYDVLRADELALLLPAQRALIFGDAMLRRPDGTLRVCPESWTQPAGGPAALRRRLTALAELPVAHVLVMHGPFATDRGLSEMRDALGA